MDNPKNKQNDHLGVNKMGRNIRKSPLHQPNFPNSGGENIAAAANNISNRQQPQPHVYNISKNDFRSVVQQLTGSPSHDSSARTPQHPPRSQNTRLHKIRPPSLGPLNRPHIPAQVQPLPVVPPMASHPNSNYPRPPLLISGEPNRGIPAESPISAYMRFLQSSITEAGPGGDQAPRGLHPTPQPHPPGFFQPQQPGLLFNPPPPLPFPSPPANGQQPGLNPPPPQMNGQPPLPSPTSQFLLSPGFMGLLSPRSPYPVVSPGIQFPPLSPTFTFSPFPPPGLPGHGPQPPLSPGLMYPFSPSSFFQFPSPRWREN